MSSTAPVAVGVVVAVVLLLAYLTMAPRTRSIERLRVAVLGDVFLAYVGIVGMMFVEPPVAAVCDLGSPNVELSSTAKRGYFDQLLVGGGRHARRQGQRSAE